MGRRNGLCLQEVAPLEVSDRSLKWRVHPPLQKHSGTCAPGRGSVRMASWGFQNESPFLLAVLDAAVKASLREPE